MTSITSTSDKTTFERVHREPSWLQAKILKSESFRKKFQLAVAVGTGIAYTAILLPASIVLAAITLVALGVLGLCSPALLHPKTAKVWRIVKNKLLGFLTDLVHLPQKVLATRLALEPDSQQDGQGSRPLVVLVHGFLHNKSCWTELTQDLCRATENTDHPLTERDVYAINLGNPVTLEQIDRYARLLATELEKIRQERKVDKLDIVLDSHSMGGLVAGKFAASYAEAAGINVLRLISNGTPWHGTPLARFGTFAECGCEMRTDHCFTKGLTDEMKPLHERIYTIASKGDTVVPYHSARGSNLPIPDDHRLTLDNPHLGHIAMLSSRQLLQENVRLIIEALH